MIGDTVPDFEKALFIPHAPASMELPERIAWRNGYRAALKMLNGEDEKFLWCEKHQSTSPATDQCDYARWKGYEGPPNECELVPCSVVSQASDDRPTGYPESQGKD